MVRVDSRVFRWALLAVLTSPVGCGDDSGGGSGGTGGSGIDPGAGSGGGVNGGGSGNGANAGAPASTTLGLEQACTAGCNAQTATNCPGLPSPGQCTDACIGIGNDFPRCAGPWKDLNACMATAPLTCDPVNGSVSVSARDCGPQIDAFSKCGP